MAEEGHRLTLSERRQLQLSGVISVDSFDSENIELNTKLGGLQISGTELKIGTLNLNDGQVAISGAISGLVYGKSREEKSGRHKTKNVISRLLK